MVPSVPFLCSPQEAPSTPEAASGNASQENLEASGPPVSLSVQALPGQPI